MIYDTVLVRTVRYHTVQYGEPYDINENIISSLCMYVRMIVLPYAAMI